MQERIGDGGIGAGEAVTDDAMSGGRRRGTGIATYLCDVGVDVGMEVVGVVTGFGGSWRQSTAYRREAETYAMPIDAGEADGCSAGGGAGRK